MPKWAMTTDETPKVAVGCSTELLQSGLTRKLSFTYFSALFFLSPSIYLESPVLWMTHYHHCFSGKLFFAPFFCLTGGEGKEQGAFLAASYGVPAACSTPRWWQVQADSAPRALHGTLHHCKQTHAQNSSENWKQRCSNLVALTPHPFAQSYWVNPTAQTKTKATVVF